MGILDGIVEWIAEQVPLFLKVSQKSFMASLGVNV